MRFSDFFIQNMEPAINFVSPLKFEKNGVIIQEDSIIVKKMESGVLIDITGITANVGIQFLGLVSIIDNVFSKFQSFFQL